MIPLLGVVGSSLRTLAGLCLLVLALSLMTRVRKGLPILTRAEGKQWWLVLTACLAWILGSGASAWRERLEAQSWLELSQGPNGELVQRATLAVLQAELKSISPLLQSQASAYFNAGEHDLAAMRYRDAIGSYERAVQTFPTASAYLNLGVSLLYLAEFRRAEHALLSGIQVARQEGNDRMEGAYLDGLGRAYLGQGRLEAALASHRAALEMHTQVGNPLGRANAHANMGHVLLAQGRLEEALISHREAFWLYTKLGNLLGRANALNHIGAVYIRLAKQDEALRALHEALSLNREIGNPLGQARDLDGIRKVYLAQGRRREASEMLRQSETIYREIGTSPGNALEPRKANATTAR